MRIYKGIFVLAFMAALVPNVWGGIGAFLTALAVWAFAKRRDLQAWAGTGHLRRLHASLPQRGRSADGARRSSTGRQPDWQIMRAQGPTPTTPV